MCDSCVEWGGKRWHRYRGGYYERTDKSARPKRTIRLHRAIWEAEQGPIPDGWQVHHRDEDVGNNSLANLECIPAGEHRRIHLATKPIPRPDWGDKPLVGCVCADCGAAIQRKRPGPQPVCKSCQYRRAEQRRKHEKTCTHCGAQFRSRAGNFCSQRCVNLATNGAQVSVLPEGRRRA